MAKKITISEMCKLAVERGGRCMSGTYVDARSKLLWECAEGHQWESAPTNIKSGKWCPTCGGTKKLSLAHFCQIAHERGGKCLSKKYINTRTKLLWECAEGHQWEALPMNVSNGTWCTKCFDLRRGDSRKLTIEEMHQIAADRCGRCLSEIYTNTRTKLLWECSKGHAWEAVPSDVKKGTWCPECYINKQDKNTKQEQPAGTPP